MARVGQSVTASTQLLRPVEAILEVLNEDGLVSRLNPNVERRDIVSLAGGGHECRQVHHHRGRTHEIRVRAVEWDPPNRFVFEDDKGVRTTLVLDPVTTRRTRIVLQAEWTTRRGRFLRKATAVSVQQQLERMLDRLGEICDDSAYK